MATLVLGIVMREAMVALTGPSGIGKTTVLREALRKPLLARAHISRIDLQPVIGSDTSSQARGVIAQILARPVESMPKPSMDSLLNAPASLRRGLGPRLLVVDDAHLLSADTIHMLHRLLTTREGDPVWQAILVGKPELRDALMPRRPGEKGSVVPVSCVLGPLTDAEARNVVACRLGRSEAAIHEAIADDALALLLEAGEKRPGLICALLDAASRIAAGRPEKRNRGVITREAVADGILALSGPRQPPDVARRASEAFRRPVQKLDEVPHPKPGRHEVARSRWMSSVACGSAVLVGAGFAAWVVGAAQGPTVQPPTGHPVASLLSPGTIEPPSVYARTQLADGDATGPPAAKIKVALSSVPMTTARAESIAFETAQAGTVDGVDQPASTPADPTAGNTNSPAPDETTASPAGGGTTTGGESATPPADEAAAPPADNGAPASAANEPEPPPSPSTPPPAATAPSAVGSAPVPDTSGAETAGEAPVAPPIAPPESAPPAQAGESAALPAPAPAAPEAGTHEAPVPPGSPPAQAEVPSPERTNEAIAPAQGTVNPAGSSQPAQPATAEPPTQPAAAEPPTQPATAEPPTQAQVAAPSADAVASNKPLAAPAAPTAPRPVAPATVDIGAASGVQRLPKAITDALLAKGDSLFAVGDVSAARLCYERAAEGGSARAAAAAGKTYDPAFLASISAKGMRPDPGSAASWYRKAAALGDTEAPALLRQLRGASD